MKNEIKEILDILKDNTYVPLEDGRDYKLLYKDDDKLLLDYITNLQEENEFLKLNNPEMNMEHFRIIKENKRKIDNLREENKRLKKIAHKMHLWIFLHSGDEQKVYDELGLIDEENAMLGYSGQFRIGEDKDE